MGVNSGMAGGDAHGASAAGAEPSGLGRCGGGRLVVVVLKDQRHAGKEPDTFAVALCSGMAEAEVSD